MLLEIVSATQPVVKTLPNEGDANPEYEADDYGEHSGSCWVTVRAAAGARGLDDFSSGQMVEAIDEIR